MKIYYVRPMDLHDYAPRCDNDPCVPVVPESDYDALAARLAEAEALLREIRDHFGNIPWKRIDAFLAPDSADEMGERCEHGMLVEYGLCLKCMRSKKAAADQPEDAAK